MIMRLARLSSASNLADRSRRGQISTLLILAMVIMLAGIMATVNLGQVAVQSTSVANATDAAALNLGSQLATRSFMLRKGLRDARGGEFHESSDGRTVRRCQKGGLLGVILAIIGAIIAVTNPAVAAALGHATFAPAVAGALGGFTGNYLIYGNFKGAMAGAVMGYQIGAAIGAAFKAFGFQTKTVGAGKTIPGGEKISGAKPGTVVEKTDVWGNKSQVGLGPDSKFSFPSDVKVVSGQVNLSQFSAGAANTGMALAAGSALLNGAMDDMAKLQQLDAAARALNGLPAYNRIQQSVIFDAMSRIIDDPTMVKDVGYDFTGTDPKTGAPKKYRLPSDIDGDGDTTDQVSRFSQWWTGRSVELKERLYTKGTNRSVPEEVTDFLDGPLARFGAKAASFIKQCDEGDIGLLGRWEVEGIKCDPNPRIPPDDAADFCYQDPARPNDPPFKGAWVRHWNCSSSGGGYVPNGDGYVPFVLRRLTGWDSMKNYENTVKGAQTDTVERWDRYDTNLRARLVSINKESYAAALTKAGYEALWRPGPRLDQLTQWHDGEGKYGEETCHEDPAKCQTPCRGAGCQPGECLDDSNLVCSTPMPDYWDEIDALNETLRDYVELIQELRRADNRGRVLDSWEVWPSLFSDQQANILDKIVYGDEEPNDEGKKSLGIKGWIERIEQIKSAGLPVCECPVQHNNRCDPDIEEHNKKYPDFKTCEQEREEARQTGQPVRATPRRYFCNDKRTSSVKHALNSPCNYGVSLNPSLQDEWRAPYQPFYTVDMRIKPGDSADGRDDLDTFIWRVAGVETRPNADPSQQYNVLTMPESELGTPESDKRFNGIPAYEIRRFSKKLKEFQAALPDFMEDECSNKLAAGKPLSDKELQDCKKRRPIFHGGTINSPDYVWDDSRGYHKVEVGVMMLRMPKIKRTSRGFFKKTMCLRLDQFHDPDGSQTWVKARRVDYPKGVNPTDPKSKPDPSSSPLWDWRSTKNGKPGDEAEKTSYVRFNWDRVELKADPRNR